VNSGNGLTITFTIALQTEAAGYLLDAFGGTFVVFGAANPSRLTLFTYFAARLIALLELPDVHSKIAATESAKHIPSTTFLHTGAVGNAHGFHAVAVELDIVKVQKGEHSLNVELKQ